MKELMMKPTVKKLLMGQVKIKVDPNMRDHSNDPFVLRKNEMARKSIEKYGLPPQLLKIQAERMKK